jgi:hypothetical protein
VVSVSVQDVRRTSTVRVHRQGATPSAATVTARRRPASRAAWCWVGASLTGALSPLPLWAVAAVAVVAVAVVAAVVLRSRVAICFDATRVVATTEKARGAPAMHPRRAGQERRPHLGAFPKNLRSSKVKVCVR